MKKCVVIYNPYSGRKVKQNFLTEFVDILLGNDYDPDIQFSKYKGHITEIIKELPDTIDLVISLGGDGTFNEVMSGNLKRNKRLVVSHIPLGTTNDIGKMFGYGKNIINNLKLLLSGEARGIDICTINGRPFVYVAGFGRFMNIPYETSRGSKKTLGYLAYLLSGAKDLFKKNRMYDITYTVDGEEYNGIYAFMLIGNATRIAGFNNVFPDVQLDDDKFEVLLCNINRKKDIIKMLYYLRKTNITRVPGFYFHRTNSLKIKFNDPDHVDWCLDGEKLETDDNSFKIEIVKNVMVRIPKKNISKLLTK